MDGMFPTFLCLFNAGGLENDGYVLLAIKLELVSLKLIIKIREIVIM